jgi:hypothetical protein
MKRRRRPDRAIGHHRDVQQYEGNDYDHERRTEAAQNPAHWRARIERVQNELNDKKRLYDKVSHPAKKDLGRYIDQLKKTLMWLQKMA